MHAEKAKPDYDRESYILVVDDDSTLLKFFKIHLNKFFSRVIVVKNVKEAVHTLKEKQIDLVISDIDMPRVDGFELMKKVRRKDLAIPVLLISGAFLQHDKEEMVKEADGYLRKPFSIDQLHSFIQHGMEKRARLAKLLAIATNQKNLKKILQGEGKIERLVGKENVKEAKEIITALKKETEANAA